MPIKAKYILRLCIGKNLDMIHIKIQGLKWSIYACLSFLGLRDAHSIVLTEVEHHINANSPVRAMSDEREKSKGIKNSNVGVAPKGHKENTNWNGF